MINLKLRSGEKELLDKDDIPFADIKQNMRELNSVNKLLGGHAITIDGIKKLNNSRHFTACEIGCGGGDNLKAISGWCAANDITCGFYGVDIKPACIEYAKQQYPNIPAIWIMSDYAEVDFRILKPDIIFSSLFCHHFTEEELIKMLGWMKRNSAKGFFINDLQRNLLAYYLIKWLTGIFSKSYLVKNDAPLSVARGFKKKEWQKIFSAAGIKNYSIRWKWAFRYLIVCKNEP